MLNITYLCKGEDMNNLQVINAGYENTFVLRLVYHGQI